MDIALFPTKKNEGLAFDIALESGSISSGTDLRTSIILSLFCDRRAADDDTLPDVSGSRRGWWGDALQPRAIGSRLWLLAREKQLGEVVNRAREYARESVAWLLEDGIVDDLEVDAEIVAFGVLGFSVRVFKPFSKPETYRFNYLWQDASFQAVSS